jgi:ABC-type transport system involved in multi-copper enzyme maturation permease subunit
MRQRREAVNAVSSPTPVTAASATAGISSLNGSSWRVLVALILDTIQEARARWLFWGLFGLSTLLILFFLFVLKIDLVQGAVSLMDLGPIRTYANIEKFVRMAYMFVAVFLYIWGTFLAVFASSGLIPSVLEPGRIGLLLSKPISRPMLLIGRYIGNLLVVSVNNTYLIGAIWIIIGIKTDIWNTTFLYAIPLTILIFAVLLSVVVFIGVISESAALSVMVAAALMLISAVLAQRKIVVQLLSSEWSRNLWQGLYWVLPKVYDLAKAMHDMILKETAPSLVAPLWTSALFGIVIFLAALVIFQRKDY